VLCIKTTWKLELIYELNAASIYCTVYQNTEI